MKLCLEILRKMFICCTLAKVRWENGCHLHICLLNMKLQHYFQLTKSKKKTRNNILSFKCLYTHLHITCVCVVVVVVSMSSSHCQQESKWTYFPCQTIPSKPADKLASHINIGILKIMCFIFINQFITTIYLKYYICLTYGLLGSWHVASPPRLPLSDVSFHFANLFRIIWFSF